MGIGLNFVGYLIRRIAAVYKPTLKIAADIFRYLGDQEYRDDLCRKMHEAVSVVEKSEVKHLFIFTHSLGTVIAVDALRTMQFKQVKSVMLVTSGSPLRRFFHRFFPGEYAEPRRQKELLMDAAGKDLRFEWINVYRHLDPVGTELGLGKEYESPVARDNETRLNAHLNYWGDPVVHNQVRELIAGLA